VPYHNFTHAFNITHYLYVIIRKTKLRETFLDDLDLLALLISGIGHDLDHPGVGNTYYTKLGHNLALPVND